MKKTWFFAVLSIVLCTNAFASCKVTTCSPGGDSSNSILSTSGVVGSEASGQCYNCNWGDNDYECGEGTIIAIKHPDYVFNQRIKSFFYCSDTGKHDDTWTNHDPSDTCGDSEVKSTAQNAEKFFAIDGTKTGAIESSTGDSIVLGAGNHGCVMYKCKSGYVPTADKENCVQDTRNTKCKTKDGNSHPNGFDLSQDCIDANESKSVVGKLDSVEHIKSGAQCTVTCAENGWDLTLKEDSCESKYGPNTAKKKCVKTQETINNENAAAARRKKCTDSGGTWVGSKCKCDNSKNLRLESGECVCLDSTNYRRNGNQCILTDAAALQRECDGAVATGAYWDASTKQCRCSNPQHAFINKQCRMNPAIEACNQIPGAKWNQIANECRCTDPKKELNADGTACVETDEARQEREESEASAQLSAARSKITKSASALKNMSEGFKVSVWKNKEGNFNTARLASDSIAGVVLGTAGGLITSNVVKKNQVKSGFEDIQCTIGGQVVADWGDEFRVGIQ